MTAGMMGFALVQAYDANRHYPYGGADVRDMNMAVFGAAVYLLMFMFARSERLRKEREAARSE